MWKCERLLKMGLIYQWEFLKVLKILRSINEAKINNLSTYENNLVSY